MSSDHTISIATMSRDDARRANETPVAMPVGELMASNGLVTGQSGADPAESVLRIAESLLDDGETLCIVDPDGRFGALADHSSMLHVGGSRDCDVQVRPDAVDRVASLALGGSTSILLDLEGFAASGADDLLGGLTDALVDARRDRRGDLLLVVGNCHRWLAASGPATRTGENLVQIGGRGHAGLGIVGVTDQPADVREDVLTGVDWLLAHRLTWREDLRALERLLDGRYVNALDSLDDGEALFTAGWESGVQRVELGTDTAGSDRRDRDTRERDGRERDGRERDRGERSQPNHEPPSDANGTRRAESNDDLLVGLDEARAPEEDDEDHESVREDVAAIENRLASLEAKVDAREDVETMADRIAEAITDALEDAAIGQPVPTAEVSQSEETEASESPSMDSSDDATIGDDPDEDASGANGPGDFGDVFGMFDDDSTADTGDGSPDPASTDDSTHANGSTTDSTADLTADDGTTAFGDAATPPSPGGPSASDGDASESSDGGSSGMSFQPIDFSFDEPARDVDSTVPDDFGPPSRHGSSGRSIPRYLRKIVRGLEEMDETTRRMLAYYVEEGTESPMDAHVSAGGRGDRTRAYAHNRHLRTTGLIEHVGKGKYAPRLREYVVDQAGHSVPEHELDRAEDVIRQTVEAA